MSNQDIFITSMLNELEKVAESSAHHPGHRHGQSWNDVVEYAAIDRGSNHYQAAAGARHKGATHPDKVEAAVHKEYKHAATFAAKHNKFMKDGAHVEHRTYRNKGQQVHTKHLTLPDTWHKADHAEWAAGKHKELTAKGYKLTKTTHKRIGAEHHTDMDVGDMPYNAVHGHYS